MKSFNFEMALADAAITALESLTEKELTPGSVKVALILATDFVDMTEFGKSFDGDYLRRTSTPEGIRRMLESHQYRDDDGEHSDQYSNNPYNVIK
ncbi:hypothetical protein [Pseudoflavonifractor phocaeensis]|uniref:hypothetical protein n=1 Tax=Pseudoflavonifractor phocaeensis TaxID=1870988 RepID=UPI00195D0299|nr:hypothetical protein [Pseudoflavonifractor phocaeensis]MBM6886970.1 hypothetical protein [Pseudoflavonifractor phocaeensis]